MKTWLTLTVLLFTEAASAEVRVIGQFRDWNVYMEQQKGDTVCFAATAAMDKAPKNVQHGNVHFFVANWKVGSAKNQPSLKVGYPLRTDQQPVARIGKQKWEMFAVNQEAFFETSAEGGVINALKKGSQLRVEAVSKRGTNTAYHFSLSGSGAAIRQAVEICSKE